MLNAFDCDVKGPPAVYSDFYIWTDHFVKVQFANRHTMLRKNFEKFTKNAFENFLFL